MLSTDIVSAAPEGSQTLNPKLKRIQGRRSACRDCDFIVVIHFISGNSTQNLHRRPSEQRGRARAHSRRRYGLACPRASAPPRCKALCQPSAAIGGTRPALELPPHPFPPPGAAQGLPAQHPWVLAPGRTGAPRGWEPWSRLFRLVPLSSGGSRHLAPSWGSAWWPPASRCHRSCVTPTPPPPCLSFPTSCSKESFPCVLALLFGLEAPQELPRIPSSVQIVSSPPLVRTRNTHAAPSTRSPVVGTHPGGSKPQGDRAQLHLGVHRVMASLGWGWKTSVFPMAGPETPT